MGGVGRVLIGARPSARVAMAVVLSLAVFEPAEWVEALFANALLHSEEATRIIVHLNAAVDYYSPELVRRWNDSNPRLGIGPHRVPVQWGLGGILYGHLINAEHAAQRWPEARYIVFQASNMMWHRAGWEVAVRRLKWSVQEDMDLTLEPPTRGNSMRRLARRHPLYRNLTGSCSPSRHATHYVEGSFYPIKTVLRFASYLRDWMERATAGGICRHWQGDNHTAPCSEPHPRAWYRGRPGNRVNSSASTFGSSYQLDEILFAFPYPEEHWLPAYALNVERLTPQQSAPSPLRGRQLCYRYELNVKSVPTNLFETMRSNLSFQLSEECEGEPSSRLFAIKRVTKAPEQPLARMLLACDGRRHHEMYHLHEQQCAEAQAVRRSTSSRTSGSEVRCGRTPNCWWSGGNSTEFDAVRRAGDIVTSPGG